MCSLRYVEMDNRVYEFNARILEIIGGILGYLNEGSLFPKVKRFPNDGSGKVPTVVPLGLGNPTKSFKPITFLHALNVVGYHI